jgi:hypothetical protein
VASVDSEDSRTNKLLEVIADELYMASVDSEDKFQGRYTDWKQKDRDALHKKIEDLRAELKL